MLDSLLNADILYYAYTILGFLIFSVILIILKFIASKTKNTVDDKVVGVLAEWHEVNKSKIKK